MDILADEAVIAEYPYHAFVDINGNGVPVLFMSTTEDKFVSMEDKAAIYLYDSGEPKKVLEDGGQAGDVFYAATEGKTLTHYYRLSGEEHIEVYKAENGALELVTKADSYQPNHGPAGDSEPHYYPDEEITEESATELWGAYATDSVVFYEPMAQYTGKRKRT